MARKLLRPPENMPFAHTVAVSLILTFLASTLGLAQTQFPPLPASGKVNGKIAFAAASAPSGPAVRNIYTIEPDGSNKTLLLGDSSSDTEVLFYSTPSYSSDGTKIALVRTLSSAAALDVQIYVANADGTNVRRVTDTKEVVNGHIVSNELPAWSPDGKNLAFMRGYSELRQDGGELIIVGHYAIYSANADGTNEQKLTGDAIQNGYPAWSPDGKKIAYSTADPFERNDIFVMDADGGNKTNVTNNGSSSFAPSWSPDGKKIAFVSVRDATPSSAFNIYTINADGTGLVRLTDVPGQNSIPVWSPDGTKIAFLSNRDTADGHFEIYTMNPDGSEQRRLTFTMDGQVGWVTWQPIPLSPPPAGIDTPQDFVTQHYRDFLSREPDAEGLNFWTREIVSCGGGDVRCVDEKRVNVSAAFFLSIEFQQTGYLVHRLYKAAYGRAPRLQEFLPDVRSIANGVIVKQAGWEQRLEQNKEIFINDFVNRVSFARAFPDALTAAQFVDALNANTGNTLTPAERGDLIAGLTSGAQTRGGALRKVAENGAFTRSEFNHAFVLMQYFGYLRRNPDDPPDGNLSGYNFWLNKLDDFNGDFVRAEMVRAFLVSNEYRGRFTQR